MLEFRIQIEENPDSDETTTKITINGITSLAMLNHLIAELEEQKIEILAKRAELLENSIKK